MRSIDAIPQLLALRGPDVVEWQSEHIGECLVPVGLGLEQRLTLRRPTRRE